MFGKEPDKLLCFAGCPRDGQKEIKDTGLVVGRGRQRILIGQGRFEVIKIPLLYSTTLVS